MAIEPVAPERIVIAQDFGLKNVDYIAIACREAGVPFPVACALFEKESKGINQWGNDEDGFFRELPPEFLVTKSTFEVFEYYVMELGRKSNGVGPAQITWKGFFPDMRKRGLWPWNVHDNMLYGLELLHLYKAKLGATWETAGTAYNGQKSYGIDLAEKVNEWRERLRQ
jgi:hypothetical protein